ncbi:MAG: hypothetical protein KAU06_05805 [Candidatus Marinimicrobia bacterium]|nr:hypothetical protein [Candidatus Neomarinimicrobiota bacterium]
MFTLPAFAGSFLPGFADIAKESTVFTLYGGSDGQELWLVVEENLLEEEPGDLLEGIGDIVGLTPSSIYAWYRTRGDIAGDLPEEAQDFFYGIQYDTDTTSDRFGPFIATEIVKWTTDIEMNIGYFGIGTDWNVNEDLTLRGAFWNDFGENYRITGNAHWNPYGAIEVNAMAWLMIDDGDEWGLWRIRASHPVDNDLDIVLVVEDSTRSDTVFLMGFSYNL